ncbi:MAG: hypothetical protein MUF73_06925 [Rhodobacteraceae bacterium]|jgi:hypothetical protein|nr:hypothetical protein [Paracoccaceae bacterium]
MNRAVRRKLRRRAVELAGEYVRGGIVVAGVAGGAARITSDATLRLVREELVAVLRAGGEPRMRRLSAVEVAGFPFSRGPVEGGEPWLATGIDCDGRATVVTRWLPSGCGDAALAALRAVLRAQLVSSGLPMPDVMAGSA